MHTKPQPPDHPCPASCSPNQSRHPYESIPHWAYSSCVRKMSPTVLLLHYTQSLIFPQWQQYSLLWTFLAMDFDGHICRHCLQSDSLPRLVLFSPRQRLSSGLCVSTYLSQPKPLFESPSCIHMIQRQLRGEQLQAEIFRNNSKNVDDFSMMTFKDIKEEW